ncbi:MAG: MotA/TolQ/ExbB proton channel family protein [Bacteroidales bacterium]|nr:MotA/TolQ/ExbB proton channel family protein [Bacteroidales bacterium]
MKKLIAFLTLAGLLSFGFTNMVIAQEEVVAQTEGTNEVAAEADSLQVAVADQVATLEEDVVVDKGFHQVLKEQFIAGGAGFMGIVLLTLIFGLALSVERIIYLNLSTTNTKKLLNKVETALQNGGVDAAKDVCKNTKGPVASIFWQGLHKYEDGLDIVEKSIVAYGGVLMGRLEKGLTWISLFIALAPMLGFMGTVIGMIGAFSDIAAAGTISATVVAGGIQVALLTTVFGLIVAAILQIFYNYIVAKIDSIVNDMEDSTIGFVDILSNYKSNK